MECFWKKVSRKGRMARRAAFVWRKKFRVLTSCSFPPSFVFANTIKNTNTFEDYNTDTYRRLPLAASLVSRVIQIQIQAKKFWIGCWPLQLRTIFSPAMCATAPCVSRVNDISLSCKKETTRCSPRKISIKASYSATKNAFNGSRILVCCSYTDFWCAEQLWSVAQKVESVRSLAPPPDSCGNAADDDDDNEQLENLHDDNCFL